MFCYKCVQVSFKILLNNSVAWKWKKKYMDTDTIIWHSNNKKRGIVFKIMLLFFNQQLSFICLPLFYIERWDWNRAKCFFTYIHLHLFRSHSSIWQSFEIRSSMQQKLYILPLKETLKDYEIWPCQQQSFKEHNMA